MLIDTHCHIDMFPHPEQIVRECETQKIIVIGMTNLPSHFLSGTNHLKECKYIRLALGMHPLHAKRHAEELELFKQNINRTSYIGEIGLDFSREGINTAQLQIKSLEYILGSLAGEKKILSLHSRKAENDVLDLLIRYHQQNAVFHWFSGSIFDLNKIIDNGFYFSINPAMIESSNGKKIISALPKNRILTETDSPFMQLRGKSAKPQDVMFVLNYLSKLYNVQIQIIENLVYNNFLELIKKIK